MKPKKKERGVQTFTFLPKDERLRLEQEAEREGRSLSGQIRYIIKKMLRAERYREKEYK